MTVLLIKVMLVYFLFILLFADKSKKAHAAIIFLACFIPVCFPLSVSVDVNHYIEKKEIYVMYDGAFALMLTAFMRLDKTAWKQALLLAFASLCHIMIILSIKNAHAGFFYTWYDELIIAVGILQMMVSYDGLISAFSNLQELLLRAYHYCSSSYQGLFAHKVSERRT